ncbi:MAG: hypothetical protein JWN32_2816 [Solirubrobacterales bacterium]|jgi:hypothetical protein|nr:hypothetical protein [Solirubrobacterales bacterium]
MTPNSPAPDSTRLTPRELARARLEARSRRIRLVRRRVTGVAVGVFVAVWAVMGTQLITGHDPALAKTATTTTKAPTAASTSSSSGSTSSGSSGTSSTTTSSSPAPVITSQS